MSLKVSTLLLPRLLKQTTAFKNVHVIQTKYMHANISSVQLIQKRGFMKDSNALDSGDADRLRVYYGMLTPQIRAVKWFSLTTSVAGLVAQPFIYRELSQLENIPLLVAGCTFIGFFTFGTPFLLHFVTKKYITYLDYNRKKGSYIASTVNFFCMVKETEFKPEDVHVPDIPGMFTTFVAKGKPLFLEARLFEDPSHYAKIMGYDKPMDFKLYENPSKDTK